MKIYTSRSDQWTRYSNGENMSYGDLDVLSLSSDWPKMNLLDVNIAYKGLMRLREGGGLLYEEKEIYRRLVVYMTYKRILEEE